MLNLFFDFLYKIFLNHPRYRGWSYETSYTDSGVYKYVTNIYNPEQIQRVTLYNDTLFFARLQAITNIRREAKFYELKGNSDSPIYERHF